MSNAPQSQSTSQAAAMRAELSEIDASIRFSALFFVISATFWLIIGTVLSLASAYQSHAPSFMAGCEYMTYGRLYPASVNAMLFGWGNNVIFAIGLWIMSRLCRTPIGNSGMLIVAGLFWNLGLTLGIVGIFAGDLTSVAMLELPGYATGLLVFSYALIGAWGILAFGARKGKGAYVAQWYILAALFWFPWIYVIAQFFVVWFPARGVVQAITSTWYAYNLQNLWLTPMALATAFYVIPKVLGRPIHSYYLSVLGFTSLALLACWTGMAHLTGGPIPIWMTSTGVVTSVMMVIPVFSVALNLFMTLKGSSSQIWRSPALRFIVFGICAFVVFSMLDCVFAMPSLNEIVHFTHFGQGVTQTAVYGFFSMVMFGGLYYMLPRLLNREWPSATLIAVHFWCSALGLTVIALALLLGGWSEGVQMNDASVAFVDIVQSMLPWLKLRSVGVLLLAIAHLALAINFFRMLFAVKSIGAKQGPTLLQSANQEGAA
jgi:cytochrome c oxidase cbb3-type subunit 1